MCLGYQHWLLPSKAHTHTAHKGYEREEGEGGRDGGERGREGARQQGRKGNLHSTLMNQADIVTSVTTTYIHYRWFKQYTNGYLTMTLMN